MEVTDEKFILDCISGYKIRFIKKVDASLSNNFQIKVKHKQYDDHKKDINELIEKGAVVACKESKDQFVSSYFLRKKPNGSYRFILNLKNLNKFIKTDHFKLEDLRTAVQLTFPNYFLSTIDLEDAYFLVSIHINSRKYLRFRFNDQLFEFVCLPFGLCTAPYIFTKIMKVVMKKLRSSGFSSVIYIDDILCIEKSIEQCQKNIDQTINFLEYLGFCINYKKSNLMPSKRCKFLGMVIDTEKYAIELPREKRETLYDLITQFLNYETCSIKKFSQLIGILISCCPAIEYAWLYTKELEKEKLFHLIFNDYDYNKSMEISETVKQELKWWKNNIKDSVHFIKDGVYDMTIHTDASTTGWGATDGINDIYGFWSKNDRQFHINYLELLTVKLALETLAAGLRDAQILLRVDNTTAISYINKMGGIRLDKFCKLAREIWQWAEHRRIILIASYIPSKENVIADNLSRISNVDTEWELNSSCYKTVVNAFGPPQIDLFASRLNAKCKQFISRTPEIEACYVDAFTINWSEFYFYAFPPFSLALRTLAKIRREKAYGIVVVPYWRNQPWFPMFEQLMVGQPIIFKPNPKLLLSPCRSRQHPRAEHLALIASRVSGRPL